MCIKGSFMLRESRELQISPCFALSPTYQASLPFQAVASAGKLSNTERPISLQYRQQMHTCQIPPPNAPRRFDRWSRMSPWLTLTAYVARPKFFVPPLYGSYVYRISSKWPANASGCLRCVVTKLQFIKGK